MVLKSCFFTTSGFSYFPCNNFVTYSKIVDFYISNRNLTKLMNLSSSIVFHNPLWESVHALIQIQSTQPAPVAGF